MREVAVPDYRSVPGNHGAFVLRQTKGETTDFMMLTFWDSKDAIEKFAGDDIETAKYYEFDRDFLIELDPQVKHYELYEGSASGQRGAADLSLAEADSIWNLRKWQVEPNLRPRHEHIWFSSIGW